MNLLHHYLMLLLEALKHMIDDDIDDHDEDGDDEVDVDDWVFLVVDGI